MKKETKRILSVLLALVMLFSLFPASAFADAGGEPEENEGQIAPVEESAPSENEGEIAPIDEPAPAEEPEELRKPYTLSGRALTFKANGTPDTSNTGGAILVASTAGSGESVSAEVKSVVTCQTQAADGYRLVAVYFGPSSAPLSYDVTNSKLAIMPSEAAVFTAVFIPEGAKMPCRNAGVILSAPPLGGSYSGLVNADVTKYFNKDGAAYSALDAYSVSAVWKEEGGANPTSFQIGKSYYAVITVTFNSGWSLGSNFQAALTMPDGSTYSDFVMEKVPGGVSFHSPLYTIPATEGWYNLYGNSSTYNANGAYDENLTGGTIRVSTGCAQEGDTVSCTVTPASGYHLAYILYGGLSGEPVADVTDTRQAAMLARNTQFHAVFVADGGTLSFTAAAVRITEPTLNQSYGGPVPATLTKYQSFPGTIAVPSTFHVENATWVLFGGTQPTILLPGRTYYVSFDLVAKEGFRFTTEEDPIVEITMPDGSVKRSDKDFNISRNADGSIHVTSPLYTTPGSTSYHHVSTYIWTYNTSGELDSSLVGGTVTLSKDRAQTGETVSCTVMPAAGYRVATVLFGGYGQEPDADVTATLTGTMRNYDEYFYVTFVPEGVQIPSHYAAAVQIGAPSAGGNYPNGVPVNTTKYYSFPMVVAAPSSFEVRNAVWTIKYGGTPTTLLAGNSYVAEFDIYPSDCYYYPEDENLTVELTMPDGSVVDSYGSDVTVTRNADGSFHVKSPEYTLPGSSSYHHLMGRALTYDENGIYDESLAGGTVTVSAGSAKAGDAVSCQVTVNPGYRLLMVQFCLDHDEPAADVTDSLQAVMWDRDMEFRATFVKDGGSIGCQALAVQLGNPKASGYRSLPAAPALTPYLSMTSLALYPTAFSVTDASWRNANGECIGWFYDVQDYYALFTLRPNPGWTFADNCLIELTMPDGSILRNTDGDFTATPNADGSITVKSPMLHVPSTETPVGGAIPVVFRVEVYDADYHLVPDVIGGTASYSPANPHPGDTVTVTASPAPGYQLQYVYYDNGVIMGYDATAEMSFTVPEDYGGIELAVCFTPVGTSLPLPSATQKVELPLAGALNSGSGRVLNGEHQWYDVESVTWYGGAGSGCQGQEPTRFLPGASYYAEVVLTPHAHWYWKPDTNLLMLYHDPADPDPGSVNWDLPSGSTCSLDSQGRLHIVGQEIPLPASTLGSVDLGIQMFQEGGEYPEGCPVVFELPDDAFFTVSDAIWYNYANQESGGIGLAAGFFTADGRYFTEFDLIPKEGYTFTANTQVVLTNGTVEEKRLNSDGSIHVVTSWYSLNPENAAQQRRVFVTNYVMNADGTVSPSGSGGYVLPNDGSPKVGDTLIFGVMPKNGYRLQWMTAARDSEQVGEDITESLEFYVADEPGDVYVSAFFALADEPVTCSQVDLNVQLPAPGGNYSGLAPATVTPDVVNASKYTVVSTRWYETQEHGVGTPSSFVPGERYCVEILLAPNPGWSFGDNPGAFLLFSDGTSMDSRFGEVYPYKRSDGNLVLTSNFITLPETAVDSVELSLDLPEEGDSFEFMSQPWATFYTPHVGEMYTIWKNGADQATGEEGSQTASFQPGCVYYATIRLHADQGYYLTEDTRVTLRNGLSFTTQYSTTDRSLWIHTESITIPTDRYQLSGTYVSFRLNDVEVTSARPGDYVVVRSDITTQPLGVYLANVTSEDVELKQITEITWGFTMPEKDVTVTGELLPQETYIFELEDGVHEMNARDASWLFGEFEAGYRLEKDLTGDGNTDIYVDFYDDGTARVVRVGNICGDLVENTPSGRIGTIIYRFGPERYDVYLGSVQVNAENKNNIPVLGGKASYDPETRTLTLTDYTGSIGVIGKDDFDPDLTRLFSITASGDLTIRGSGRLTNDSLRGGINCGGNLTLDGDFEISAWLHGICAEGDLTVSGKVKVRNTTQMGVDVRGDLSVTQGSLRVTADEGIGVDCRGDVTVNGELYSFAGKAGLQCGGNVTLAGGVIMVSSTNDIGLIGSSDLNIQNGGFSAYGNVQALEVASISFDTSTHFISLPENGYVSSDDTTTIIDPVTSDPALNAQITDKTPTTTLRVKDLDGKEGVGGYVSFGSGDYFVETSNTVPYGTWLDISASAAPGYLFDHWEDEYGARPNDESDRAETSVGVFSDGILYAVFEELLPIDAEHFPDAKFRSLVAGEGIDKNGDGYLSRTERQAVTRIEAPSMNIADLKGIGYFPELTYLDVRDNKLQRLDLTGNPKLDTVHCHQNYGLTSLNVTKCPELRILQCYSTSLANLNLNYNTKLESLVCNATRLVTLDLSQCRVLKAVLCQNCSSLKQLHLNSDNLKRLLCFGTKLQQLDLSACSIMSRVYHVGSYTPASTNAYDEYWLEEETNYPWILRVDPDTEFSEDLGIPVNRPNFPDDDFRAVVSSDVDSNKNDWLSPMEIANAEDLDLCGYGIASLQGIHFLSGLKDFDAEDNRITELDLSGNPGLEAVDLYHNPLRSLKLDGLTNLQSLSCYGAELESLDLTGCPILLDAYLNGTRTEYEDRVEYKNGPLGGVLILDKDLEVITWIPGDINGDGQVDNRDVTRLLRCLRYPNVTVVEAALDVNGDGEVNNLDAETLIRYLRYGDVEIH